MYEKRKKYHDNHHDHSRRRNVYQRLLQFANAPSGGTHSTNTTEKKSRKIVLHQANVLNLFHEVDKICKNEPLYISSLPRLQY